MRARNACRVAFASFLCALTSLVLVGCSHQSESNESPAEQRCDPGLQKIDGKCVPCPDRTVATAGGGCMKVGVLPEHCQAGWTYDDARGSCEPTLPDAECPTGTMPVIGKKDCQAVGVLGTLTKEKCAPGTMALPGEPSCRKVAPCGTGTWGDIPVEPSTIYVDASYAGGGSDGTKVKPYVAIQAAIDAAASGTTSNPIVAVAAGTYRERVKIMKPLRLFGRCPEMVEVQAPAGGIEPVIDVAVTSEVGKLAVTGAEDGVAGIVIRAGAKATVSEVWAHDLGWSGVLVREGGVGTLHGLLVERAAYGGVHALSATVELDHSVVRDTQPQRSDLTRGRGVSAFPDSTTGKPSILTVSDSVVERNHQIGIYVAGSTATIERTVVRDTLPQVSDKKLGLGILAQVNIPDFKTRSTLVVSDTLVEHNIGTGILVNGSTATIERTVVRDTQLDDEKVGSDGQGIKVQMEDLFTKTSAEATIRDTLVDRNIDKGIEVIGSSAIVERTVVRDTRVTATDNGGIGIGVEIHDATKRPSTLDLHDSLVLRSAGAGILLDGSSATIKRTVVRDTAQANEGTGGGIVAQFADKATQRADLVLEDSLVEGSTGISVFVGGSTATIERSVVRNTKPDAFDARFGRGICGQTSLINGVVSDLTIRDSLVEENTEAGIYVDGSSALVDRCVVRATRARASDGAFGDGLVVITRSSTLLASLVLTSSFVDHSARGGVAVFAANLSLSGSRLMCSRFDLDAEVLPLGAPNLDDGGLNVFGCAEAVQLCKAQSAKLPPLDPR